MYNAFSKNLTITDTTKNVSNEQYCPNYSDHEEGPAVPNAYSKVDKQYTKPHQLYAVLYCHLLEQITR